MPRTRTLCGCKKCKWCRVLDSRTVEKHNQFYGSLSASPGECDSSDVDESSGSDEAAITCTVDTTDIGLDPKVTSESNYYGISDSESSENDGGGRDLDSEAANYCSKSGIADDVTGTCTVDVEDSCESESDDDTDLTDLAVGVEKSEWTFHFDNSIYQCGIAVEKISSNSNLTVLQALAMNIHFFTTHPSVSKSCFSDQLKLQKIVSNNDLLPTTYYEAKKMIKPFLVQKKEFHACPNDCIIYRKSESYDYADLQECPKCHESRYQTGCSGERYPRRRFIYIPLGPRLARIYGDVNLSQIVQSHSDRSSFDEDEDNMWDIHDSVEWKAIYGEGGCFSNDPMGLCYALELDGVNPYHNIGVRYSMIPIMLTLLNLPRHVRHAFGSIQLVGIIPGSGNSESSNVQPYVDILVDELIYLTGCTAYNAYLQAPTSVKIKLLLHVLDYPGLSKLFHQHGSGSIHGCHWCWVQGIHIPELDKVVYLSNRTYLDPQDPLRKDKLHFKDKVEDNSTSPTHRSYTSELEYRLAFENAENQTRASLIARATGSRGMYSLCRLPGHSRLDQCLPDACHTVKDVIHNIMKLLTGKSDLTKIISSERVYGRLDATAVEPTAKRKCSRKSTEDLPYVLTKMDIEKADKRASSIRVPQGFGLKPAPFISHPGSLKSHDWKQLATQGILKFCLRECLGSAQRSTLFFLLDCLSQLCSEHQSVRELPQLEQNLNRALALMERDFPLHLQNITTHILHHIVSGIQRFGPVYGTWMYVFERFNSWLCRRTLNRRYPEATVVETYILYDFCQYMICSGKLPTSCLNDLDIDITDLGETEAEKDHVKPDSKFISASSLTKNDLKQLHKLHECTLHDYTNAILSQYYRHTVVHQKTGRSLLYTCSTKEGKAAKTLSSYVSFQSTENMSGVESHCISGMYCVFGRIKLFLKHEHRGSIRRVAVVGCYKDATCDNDSGLWFVTNEVSRYCFVECDKLSPPHVTAVENDIIWFLNLGKFCP